MTYVSFLAPLANNRPFTDSYPFDAGANEGTEGANGGTEKGKRATHVVSKRPACSEAQPKNADTAYSRVACHSF